MRIPRDIDADTLIKHLARYGYRVIRQTGSHVRLTKTTKTGNHDITVPNHCPIKIGTLNSIVNDVCQFNKIDKNDFYEGLK